MRTAGYLSIVLLSLALASCDTASPDLGHADTALAAGGQERVALCHYDADADAYHRITVATPALQAHLAHGDAYPGTNGLDADCQSVQVAATCPCFTAEELAALALPGADLLWWFDDSGTTDGVEHSTTWIFSVHLLFAAQAGRAFRHGDIVPDGAAYCHLVPGNMPQLIEDPAELSTCVAHIRTVAVDLGLPCSGNACSAD